MSSLFCRHNRFTADCPICSKGTLLDPARKARATRSASPPSKAKAGGRSAPAAKRGTSARPAPSGPFAGPYVSAGPYQRDDGLRYDVRLERVPGGVRLGEWSRGQLTRRAPVLASRDVPALVAAARERAILPERDLAMLEDSLKVAPDRQAASGGRAASPGRAGDLADELRVEPVGEGMLRVGRWLLYPSRGPELSNAPTLFPADRYADALAAAARAGLLA